MARAARGKVTPDVTIEAPLGVAAGSPAAVATPTPLHKWESVGVNEDGSHNLRDPDGNEALGLGDFSVEGRLSRAVGNTTVWAPDGPVVAGKVHDIVGQDGERSTCDCQTLDADHANYAQHEVTP